MSLLSAAALAERLAEVTPRRHIPLLVMRLGELEKIAWRDGRSSARRFARRARRIFERNAARVVRAGDLLGHDQSNALFAVALTAASRRGDETALPGDCRTTLARAASALEGALRVPLETGWTLVGGAANLEREIHLALVRGAHERQRFDFFSVVGHELRTPLTSIRGYLETLLDECSDRSSRRALEIARNEALRLSRLIDGMFQISLLDSAYVEPESTRSHGSSARAALRSALEALEPRLRARASAISIGAWSDAEVAIDGDSLIQIFVNVIGNALDHGALAGTIRIEGRRIGSRLALTIDDDGPGIAAEERDAIFELGYRGKHGRAPGSGLGLAVVRRLLERAGGSVAATTSPLGGMRVVIEIAVKNPTT